jgi:DNA invertase Pin-like site-specific DNA recombinase
MKRAVVYARVSTRDQEPETQFHELKAYAKRRGVAVLRELDVESGAKAGRPKLAQLLDLARKRQVDVVLVWKFDRFARSTKQLITALEEFRELGIDFISHTENIDTSTPVGKALFTMVSAFAEFERDLIHERVRNAIARARAEGTRLGRPAFRQGCDRRACENEDLLMKCCWPKLARQGENHVSVQSPGLCTRDASWREASSSRETTPYIDCRLQKPC